jgi:hypothetical protein
MFYRVLDKGYVISVLTMPQKHMEEGRFSSTICDPCKRSASCPCCLKQNNLPTYSPSVLQVLAALSPYLSVLSWSIFLQLPIFWNISPYKSTLCVCVRVHACKTCTYTRARAHAHTHTHTHECKEI